MWGRRHNRIKSSKPSTTIISLYLETLALRDVPSSILDPSASDPTLTSLTSTDTSSQIVLVGSSDSSSTTGAGTSSTGSSTSGTDTSSPTDSSQANNTAIDSNGIATGSQAAGSNAGDSTNLTALPANSSNTANTANGSTSGTNPTANPSTTTAPTSGTTTVAGTNAAPGGGTTLMSPADGQGNGNQGNPNNPAAPQIVDFVAVETSFGMWEFSGTVIDANPAGLKVSLGGQLVSLQGESAITDANGNFGYATLLNTDGTDDGIATAQTVDGQGLVSNVAMCAVNAS